MHCDYEEGLVSVILPTFKRSEQLSRAIDSVLSQSYQNIELIVVNDNEPYDEYSRELLTMIKQYQNDHRLHLIFQEKHINGAVARNVGISKAKGEYIAFLDDDDWWKHNKIEKQILAFNNLDAEWGVVSCRIEQYHNDKLISILPKYRDGYVYKDVLMQQCDFATGTLLFRHELLDKTGYFDEQLLRNQDWQLLINFTYRYKLFQINDALHCCDISDASNRPNGEKALLYKKAFFKSIEPIYNSLSNKEKRCVQCITSFEVGYVFFRERKYIKALYYCLKIAQSPLAIRKVLNKIFIRIHH